MVKTLRLFVTLVPTLESGFDSNTGTQPRLVVATTCQCILIPNLLSRGRNDLSKILSIQLNDD